MTKLNVLYEPHIPRFRKYDESIFRSAIIYQLKGKCKKNTILRFLNRTYGLGFIGVPMKYQNLVASNMIIGFSSDD